MTFYSIFILATLPTGVILLPYTLYAYGEINLLFLWLTIASIACYCMFVINLRFLQYRIINALISLFFNPQLILPHQIQVLPFTRTHQPPKCLYPPRPLRVLYPGIKMPLHPIKSIFNKCVVQPPNGKYPFYRSPAGGFHINNMT